MGEVPFNQVRITCADRVREVREMGEVRESRFRKSVYELQFFARNQGICSTDVPYICVD